MALKTIWKVGLRDSRKSAPSPRKITVQGDLEQIGPASVSVGLAQCPLPLTLFRREFARAQATLCQAMGWTHTPVVPRHPASPHLTFLFLSFTRL